MEKIVNPLTGRKIKRNGRIYKKLVKNGTIKHTNVSDDENTKKITNKFIENIKAFNPKMKEALEKNPNTNLHDLDNLFNILQQVD